MYCDDGVMPPRPIRHRVISAYDVSEFAGEVGDDHRAWAHARSLSPGMVVRISYWQGMMAEVVEVDARLGRALVRPIAGTELFEVRAERLRLPA